MESCEVHSPTDFGGKSRVADAVWERFGDVPNFVEPFFGSGAVLLARPHEPRIETVNDIDAMIANFWRSLQHDPEATAYWASWPVSEPDLHARHAWLVNRRAWVETLMTDPNAYDAQIAGWWVWGISQWIGSGWCRTPHIRKLPSVGGTGRGDSASGMRQARQLPSLGDAGRRVQRAVHRKRPHLSGRWGGMGINRPSVSRQMPHLSDGGTGVHAPTRQLPHVGNPGRGTHSGRIRDGIYAYFDALAARLRYVRVCCGDWSRVLGPSVTEKIGTTAIFLDPPYSLDERQGDLYAHDGNIAADVRAWAIANGDNPKLRIALCGYDGPGTEMPAGWTVYRWKAVGGYGSQSIGRGRENAERECIWFNRSCLQPDVQLSWLSEVAR